MAPLLLDLLSDHTDPAREVARWKAQQQVALALCRIYAESDHCGRAYCDGDPPERIQGVKRGWQAVITADAELQAVSARELLDRFMQETIFWRQIEIGKALAAKGDRSVVSALEARLADPDRHRRGNAAYVLGRLGDPRGFDTVERILSDRSDRPPGQGIPGGRWTVAAQIRADRYYAAHLLGDLQDPRGVERLVPLMNDPDVRSVVPWSLAQIGDTRAIPPLLQALAQDDPSMRVLAISALETLHAREALPRLRELLQDHRPSNFGTQTTVAEAARHAIAVLAPDRRPF
ncbi:MAG TPA: HEAT repeat domain-containing protein [Vicinamibacterales bacterium]